jgi:hypothetical protein
MLMKLIGRNREEVRGGRKKLHKEGVQFSSLPNIYFCSDLKSRLVRWARMEKRVAQERNVGTVIAVDASADESGLWDVYFHVVFIINRVSVTKMIETSNRQGPFQILTRTPTFLILFFVIFLSPQDKLVCKTWPLPSTAFAIHYLSVVIYSTIYSVKYQQRTEVCICAYFAASLSPYGTLEIFCVTAISVGFFVCLFVFGATTPSGPGPSHSRGV